MQMQMEIVTELGPYDVLFGRGSGPNDHEGNVRFRKLVAERKAEYMATNHRLTKAKIAREIVDAVLIQNGRFLKKVEPEEARTLGIPDGIEAWASVDEDTIMEKAKQALRQNTSKVRGQYDTGNSTAPLPSNIVLSATAPLSMGMGYGASNLPVAPNVDYEVEDLEPLPIRSSEIHNRVVTSAADFGRTNPQQGTLLKATSVPVARYSMPPPPAVPQSKINSMQPPASRPSGSLRLSIDRSVDMGELMESFRSSQISNGPPKDLFNSTETMGTIENIEYQSVASMSVATVTSGIFSAAKEEGASDYDKGRQLLATNQHSYDQLQSEDPPPMFVPYKGEPQVSDFMSSMKLGMASDASMSVADFSPHSSLVRHTNHDIINKQTSAVAPRDGKDQSYRNSLLGDIDDPADLFSNNGDEGIEAMGGSSINLLKGMLLSPDEFSATSSFRQDGSGHNGAK